MELIKLQITCLCFIGYLAIFYKFNKRLNTYSGKLYGAIVWACMLNLVLDMISIYMIYNLDKVPPIIYGTFCRAFTLSINLFISLISIYIIDLIKQHQLAIKFSIVSIILLFMLTVGISFTDRLYYYRDEYTVYTYGLIVDMCFLCSAIYMIMSVYYLIRYWKSISKRGRFTAVECVAIIVITTIIQAIYPDIRISGLSGSLCALNIFIKLENPNTFLENQFDYFNDFAFITMVKDRISRGKPFHLVVVKLENKEDIHEQFGSKVERELYGMIEHYMQSMAKRQIYLYAPTVIVGIVPDARSASNIAKQLEKRFLKGWIVDNKEILVEVQVQELIISDSIESAEQVITQLVELQSEFKNRTVYRDALLQIQNRKAFEKNIEVLTQNGSQYNSLCYITADVNDLKKVNDQYGHLAGDELLKNCASILVTAIDNQEMVYRLGGDEFGILLTDFSKQEVTTLIDHIEKVRIEMNKDKEFPVSFAVGYAFFERMRDESLQDMIKRADQMMYKNKHMLKTAQRET